MVVGTERKRGKTRKRRGANLQSCSGSIKEWNGDNERSACVRALHRKGEREIRGRNFKRTHRHKERSGKERVISMRERESLRFR